MSSQPPKIGVPFQLSTPTGLRATPRPLRTSVRVSPWFALLSEVNGEPISWAVTCILPVVGYDALSVSRTRRRDLLVGSTTVAAFMADPLDCESKSCGVGAVSATRPPAAPWTGAAPQRGPPLTVPPATARA